MIVIAILWRGLFVIDWLSRKAYPRMFLQSFQDGKAYVLCLILALQWTTRSDGMAMNI